MQSQHPLPVLVRQAPGRRRGQLLPPIHGPGNRRGPGLDGNAPINATVTVGQFQTATGDREQPHAFVRADPLTLSNTLALTSPAQVRLLGEASLDAAGKRERLT